jgi:hypothetical protein
MKKNAIQILIASILFTLSLYSTVELYKLSVSETNTEFIVDMPVNEAKAEEHDKNIFQSKDAINLVIVYILNTIIIND